MADKIDQGQEQIDKQVDDHHMVVESAVECTVSDELVDNEDIRRNGNRLAEEEQPKLDRSRQRRFFGVNDGAEVRRCRIHR